MMITLTAEDFRKLSMQCQKELLALLSPTVLTEAAADDGYYSATDTGESGESLTVGIFDADPETVASPKQVVNLSIGEAKQLIAGLNGRNLEHLKKFASGDWVRLSEFYGPKPLYEDEIELKRSFIGAVNRRLRSVTAKHEKAKLFALNRQDENLIRVTPQTAAALRLAMDLQEPLRISGYRTASGKPIEKDTQAAVALRNKIDEAWKDFNGRPLGRSTDIDRMWAARHLIARGFKAYLGADIEDKTDGLKFILSDESYDSWSGRVDERGDIYVIVDDIEVWPGEIFISHHDVPDVMAELNSALYS